MSTGIRLLVGLGNPGSRYERTRHNAGFWFLDEAARHLGVDFREESRFHGSVARYERGSESLLLLKPATFMNRSGQSVVALASYFRMAPQEILVAHDELDLAPGDVRLKKGGGHGGHNGLRDILAHLGSQDFYRLRFGIGHPGDRLEVANFVLDAPSVADRALLMDAVDRAMVELPRLMNDSMAQAMNHLNGAAKKTQK